MRDDDSCTKCGHVSGGTDHYKCPVECGVCGYIGPIGEYRECPSCYVWDVFKDMSDDEKICMKELL